MKGEEAKTIYLAEKLRIKTEARGYHEFKKKIQESAKDGFLPFREDELTMKERQMLCDDGYYVAKGPGGNLRLCWDRTYSEVMADRKKRQETEIAMQERKFPWIIVLLAISISMSILAIVLNHV